MKKNSLAVKPVKASRMSKWWYLIVSPLAALFIILLLVTIGVFFLSATHQGTSLLLNRMSATFADLEITGVKGSLLGDLDIQKILWEKDGVEIEIVDAALNGLGIPPNITLQSLTTKQITLTLPKDKNEEKQHKPFEITLPDLHLPIDIDLQQVKVDELHIKQGDALLKLRDVQLSAKVVKDTLKLSNLSGDFYDDGGELVVKANGEMGLSTPHPINVEISADGNGKRIGQGSLTLGIQGEVVDYQLTAGGHWKYASYPEYQLNLLGKGNLEQLAVDRLHLEGDAGTADLHGLLTWSPQLNWDLELTGNGLNPAPFLADYSGNLNMLWVTTGSLTDKANIQLELKKLSGKLQDYPVDATMKLRVDDTSYSLSNVNVNVGSNHLTANGQAEGDSNSLLLNWHLNAPELSQLHPSIDGNLQGKGKLSGKRDGSILSLFIDNLQGKVLSYPVAVKGGLRLDDQLVYADDLAISMGDNRIQLNGSTDENTGIHWQLKAKDLSQFHPEIRGDLVGIGDLKGMIDGSRAALHIDKLHGQVQGFPVNATGDVTLLEKKVSVENVQLAVGENLVTLNGEFGDKPNKKMEYSPNLHWEINARNLSQLYADIKGQVKGSGTLSGTLDGSSYRLNIASLKGKVAGRVVNAQGDIVSEAGKLALHEVVLVAGKNRLHVNGTASEPFDLRWDINAPRLAQVWPGLGGSLKGKGVLSGRMEKPQIQADLTGKRLHYQEVSVASVDLKVGQQADIYTVKGMLKNLKQGENSIRHVGLDGNGKLEKHTFKLDIQHQDGKLNLLAAGGWSLNQWQGSVKKLSLRETQAGDWQLNHPVAIKVSSSQASSSNFCLGNKKNARFCAEGEWLKAGNTIKANGKIQQIPLSMGSPWLPKILTLPGVINADFSFSQINGKPKGKINVQLPDSSIVFRDEKGKPQILHYTRALANITVNNQQQVKLDARLDVKQRGKLHAEGQIDLVRTARGYQASRINTKATIAIPDIHWIQQYSNDIDELKGQITGDVVIRGTLGKPKITGQAQLKNASLYLPETGARLQAIGLTARANRADQMTITGSLKAGEGVLKANGKLYLASLPKWKADISVQGNRLLLMNTHEVQAQVSPNLNIKAQPQSVVITGTVKVPETSITLREIPVSAKKRSDDIIIVGRDLEKKKKLKSLDKKGNANESVININPNVLVELGDKVSFSGFGFNSRLTGSIRVQRTRLDIVTQGALNIVEGIYKAYGQELEVEHGRLIFDGSTDNPGLDIRAIRRIPGNILVGIGLRGTAQHPESELFSEPTQSETDTLSYLLTGHSVASATSGDSALLTSAVTGLGIRGGETMAQKLGGELGLDDVGISSSTGNYQDSALSIGKKIGSRLYVKYIVGLFDSIQKVAVTYQINERLQAEVLSGEQQDVDLNYKFDSNKGLFGR